MRSALALALLAGLCAPAADKTWRNPKDGMEFVWIPAGERISGFWMARTETTVAQFRRFVKETGHVTEAEQAGSKVHWKAPGFKQADNHPAVYIGRLDAERYAQWAGVAIPTEPEWLYACRAGASTRYYWGDEVDDRYVWHRDNSPEGTHPVARKLPNQWGLYDMVGNVWEWTKPLQPDGSPCEVMAEPRGGSWTRCPDYITRLGTPSGPMLYDAIKPSLTRCDPKTAGYPWDDDRGFRCVKR